MPYDSPYNAHLRQRKAVTLLEERSDGLHIGLKFAFPVAHIAADIANASKKPSWHIPATLIST